jgi:phage-related protein
MRITSSIAVSVVLAMGASLVSAAQGHRGGGAPGGGGNVSVHRPSAPAPEKTPIDEFERMPPEQQQKALAKLPPARRKKVEEQLAHLRSLPPEQRAMLRQTYSRLSELPPDRQQAVRKAFQKFGNQPGDRQQVIRSELKQLGELPADQRAARFTSPEFRKSYSRGEQQIIRDMSDLLPGR